MVRTYKRFGKPKAYSEDDLKRAVKLVEDGETIAQASQECGIPRMTLTDKINM